MAPSITLITVTYNAEKILAETLESAAVQSFKNFEHWVIDGGSKDGTVDVVKKFPHVKFISEKDNGIYDAMNKGIERAEGEFVYFLNAGDCLFNSTILLQISEHIKKRTYDMIYGDVFFKNHPSGVDFVQGRKIGFTDYYFSIALCHQAAFIKKELFNKLGLYKLNYKILADQEWFVNYFKNCDNSLYITQTVASYETIGMSHKQRFRNMIENNQIAKTYFPTHIYILRMIRHPFLWTKVWLLSKINNTKVYHWYRKLFFNN